MDSWTVKRLLEWTTDYLQKNARQSPRLEAEILLAAALSCQRIELYTSFDLEPSEDKRAVFRQISTLQNRLIILPGEEK